MTIFQTAVFVLILIAWRLNFPSLIVLKADLLIYNASNPRLK